jgi:hypothetical protein
MRIRNLWRPSQRVRCALLSLAVGACSESFEAAPSDSGEAQPSPVESGVDGMDAPDEAVEVEAESDAGFDADADSARIDAATPMPVTTDLLLWLRADVGVTESRGAVSSWVDQSGNHLDARQPDATKQPSWVGAGLLGRPTLVFDGEDFLSLPGGFADFSAGFSLFAVVVADMPDPCVDILHVSNGVEIDDIAVGRHDGRVQYEVYTDVLRGDDFPTGMPELVSVVHAKSSTATLRLNGQPFASGDLALPTNVTRLSNVVGRSLYTNCGSWNGGISEILVYRRALDTDERAHVEDYLRSRWGCCR